ncbi:MAG: hypothetical protein QNK05_00505 [Myxococcota bacterium]|nr:hypothetical protein [Myxococcota bacterium]
MQALAELLDLERYPIDSPETPATRALVERCQRGLRETGAAELPGFLRPEATAALAREAQDLVPKAHHHEGKATPYLELPEPGWPEDHPRNAWNPFSLAAVPYDCIPQESGLRALYAWEPLLDFVAACLGEPTLYRYADPLGALSLNVMEDGDEVEWHFDQADFVVSLALQNAESGGDFLSVPRIRSAEDENYPAVSRVLSGELEPGRIPMNPGTLLLFNGRTSLHCVSPTRGPKPRLVALLAYDTKPGTCASPLLQQSRYGRAQQPEGVAG